MSIGVYDGVPRHKITQQRQTSEGKEYNLNHNEDLVVDMKYYGKDSGKTTNSQGWERSSSEYFKELNKNHPEYFSEKNQKLIERGKSPVVDSKFTEYFPEYKGYENETLVHHHVGGDGQAVAVPASMHKGSGEIHTVEKQAGITKNGQDFSKKCEKLCENNRENYGKNAKELKQELKKQEKSINASENINKNNQTNEQQQNNNVGRGR